MPDAGPVTRRTLITKPDCLQLTAIHEAGHAVVAHWFGYELEEVSVKPRWREGRYSLGHVTFTHPMLTVDLSDVLNTGLRQLYHEHVLGMSIIYAAVMCAGYAAEQVIESAVFPPDSLEEERAHLFFEWPHLKTDAEQRDAMFEAARQTAICVVTQCQEEIKRVAAYLIEHREATPQQVVDIIKDDTGTA